MGVFQALSPVFAAISKFPVFGCEGVRRLRLIGMQTLEMLCTCKEEGTGHHGVRGRSVGLWLESLTPQCPKVRLFLSSRGRWIVTLRPCFCSSDRCPRNQQGFNCL